jgi:hypothetical protein
MKSTIELPFSPEDVKNGTYRGWKIGKNFVGQFEATHPDYDASYEGPEDGWVSNGLMTTASTMEGLRAEVDAICEEHGL